MLRVFSVIIVSYPPMTPARPTGFFASQTTRSSVVSLRSTPSRVFSVSPLRALRTMILTAFEQVGIEDVRGLADLPENVVGGVDGVRDGPLVEELQPMRDFLRGGLDACVVNYLRREAGTERWLFDGNREWRSAASVEERPFRAASVGTTRCGFSRCGIRRKRLQRHVVNRRRFARDAVMIHRVGTVGPDLHLEDSVGAGSADAFDRRCRHWSETSARRRSSTVRSTKSRIQLCRKFHENSAFELSLALSFIAQGLVLKTAANS